MRYYISDLHFFHKSLLSQMDHRPFDTVEDMHEYIIRVWNKKVRLTDDVVLLGDVSLGKGRETSELLERLHGKLYLIQGNHDEYFLEDREFDKSRFEWIKPYAEMHDHGKKVILCHYPVFCYNGQYRLDKEGKPKSYMLYGHVHQSRDQRLVTQFQEETRKQVYLDYEGQGRHIPCHMINCFCIRSGYVPLSLKEWIELEEKQGM